MILNFLFQWRKNLFQMVIKILCKFLVIIVPHFSTNPPSLPDSIIKCCNSFQVFRRYINQWIFLSFYSLQRGFCILYMLEGLWRRLLSCLIYFFDWFRLLWVFSISFILIGRVAQVLFLLIFLKGFLFYWTLILVSFFIFFFICLFI